MGWLKKQWDQVTGQDHARNAASSRMKAANVALNDPDYYKTTNRAQQRFDEMAGNSQAHLDRQYQQTMGQVGGAHKAALDRLSQIYGEGQQRLDTSYGQQRSDIQAGIGQNQRALQSQGNSALSSLQNQGGSLQARFAGASQIQSQMGQQQLQNQGQGNQALGQAAGQYMGATGQLAGSQGYSTSQLDINNQNTLARLGQGFAGLSQQNTLGFAQLGQQAGQQDFENLYNQALVRRGVNQEPYLAHASNEAGKASTQAGLFGMGLNLAAGAFGGLGGMAGAVGGAAGGLGQAAVTGAGWLGNLGSAFNMGQGGAMQNLMPGQIPGGLGDDFDIMNSGGGGWTG